MYFHAMQHFGKGGVIVVDNLAVSNIQFCDFRHIFSGQFKIPNVHILFHSLFVYGLRYYHNTALYVPPKRYLCGAFPVFFTNPA